MKELINNSAFFCNRDCEYYPCHELASINCLFCYCPLYLTDCGGNFHILDNGIKDCSQCLIPHIPANYSYITKKLAEVVKHGQTDSQTQ